MLFNHQMSKKWVKRRCQILIPVPDSCTFKTNIFFQDFASDFQPGVEIKKEDIFPLLLKITFLFFKEFYSGVQHVWHGHTYKSKELWPRMLKKYLR